MSNSVFSGIAAFVDAKHLQLSVKTRIIARFYINLVNASDVRDSPARTPPP
jgi:hypothetical protein